MGRRSTHNLIREVLHSLRDSPKIITEIADDTGLDRTAISRYLSVLADAGVVVEEEKGASKEYRLVPSFRTDTYFGLPLSQHQERLVHGIFNRIQSQWKQHTSLPLLSTNVQKILYRVIRECNLNEIPHGWYIYGGTGVAVFNSSESYSSAPLEDSVIGCIDSVTADYATKKAYEVKNEQYEMYATELYRLKETILKIFYGPKIHSENPRGSLHIILKFLRRLIDVAPLPARGRPRDLIDSFSDLMLDVRTKLTDDEIRALVRDMVQLFEAIWKYIALYNFKNDLLSNSFYSKELLDRHFAIDFVEQEEFVIELGTELQSQIPQDDFFGDADPALKKALAEIQFIGSSENELSERDPVALKSELGLE